MNFSKFSRDNFNFYFDTYGDAPNRATLIEEMAARHPIKSDDRNPIAKLVVLLTLENRFAEMAPIIKDIQTAEPNFLNGQGWQFLSRRIYDEASKIYPREGDGIIALHLAAPSDPDVARMALPFFVDRALTRVRHPSNMAPSPLQHLSPEMALREAAAKLVEVLVDKPSVDVHRRNGFDVEKKLFFCVAEIAKLTGKNADFEFAAKLCHEIRIGETKRRCSAKTMARTEPGFAKRQRYNPLPAIDPWEIVDLYIGVARTRALQGKCEGAEIALLGFFIDEKASARYDYLAGTMSQKHVIQMALADLYLDNAERGDVDVQLPKAAMRIAQAEKDILKSNNSTAKQSEELARLKGRYKNIENEGLHVTGPSAVLFQPGVSAFSELTI
jgi:hypothetical protein